MLWKFFLLHCHAQPVSCRKQKNSEWRTRKRTHWGSCGCFSGMLPRGWPQTNALTSSANRWILKRSCFSNVQTMKLKLIEKEYKLKKGNGCINKKNRCLIRDLSNLKCWLLAGEIVTASWSVMQGVGACFFGYSSDLLKNLMCFVQFYYWNQHLKMPPLLSLPVLLKYFKP